MTYYIVSLRKQCLHQDKGSGAGEVRCSADERNVMQDTLTLHLSAVGVMLVMENKTVI